MRTTIFKSIIPIVSVFAAVTLYNCGQDSVSPSQNQGTGGNFPNIDMRVGAVYNFTNDRVDTNITTRTDTVTTNTFLANGIFFDSTNVFQLRSVNRTGSNQVLSDDTVYIKYNSTTGKFYHYGLTRMLDTNQIAKWDLVADFARIGVDILIAEFTYTISSFTVNAKVYSKIGDSTTFNTTGTPSQIIKCFRVDIRADVSSATCGNMGSILINYYIGYSPSPSGPVRSRLNPFTLRCIGFPIYSQAGNDAILRDFTIP